MSKKDISNVATVGVLPTIKVATQGGQTAEITAKPGNSVADVVQAAGMKLGKDMTVNVDGEEVNGNDIVEAGAVVVVTPNVSNGVSENC